MTDFDRQLGLYHKMVQESLVGFLPEEHEAPRTILESMAYCLLGSGKRVRAILLLAFYEFCGGKDTEKALPFSAALEMIHAYSLAHDDLPCMDDDDMRRGKPSCHIVFNEANALLAGDGLLTLAFETMATTENMSAFGAEKVLLAVKALAGAAGATGMVGGQIMDLENEGVEVSLEELISTDHKKTGALIRASADMGCILAGADDKTRAAANEYAAKMGLAFQIIDDILDKIGDEKTLGKPIGSDEEQNKSTYVTVYGLEKAQEAARQLTDEAVTAIKSAEGNSEFLCELVQFLCNRTY